MDKPELIQEHERLVDVLNSPSHEDDKREAVKQAEELGDMKSAPSYVTGTSPEGWEDTVKQMKEHGEIENPFALAWFMKNRGYAPQASAAGPRFMAGEGDDKPPRTALEVYEQEACEDEEYTSLASMTKLQPHTYAAGEAGVCATCGAGADDLIHGEATPGATATLPDEPTPGTPASDVKEAADTVRNEAALKEAEEEEKLQQAHILEQQEHELGRIADDLDDASRRLQAVPPSPTMQVQVRAKAGVLRPFGSRRVARVMAKAATPRASTSKAKITLHARGTDLQPFAIAEDEKHPNKIPFKAVLHQVDEPSTRPPHGSNGHLVTVPRALAARKLSGIVGMGVNLSGALMGGHNAQRKIGVVSFAAIGKDPAPHIRVQGFRTPAANDVVIAGHLYAKDFPEEVAVLQSAARKGIMGASYEVSGVSVRDPDQKVWEISDLTYTGAALLRKDAAAYEGSSLAAEADTLTKEATMEGLTLEQVKQIIQEELTPFRSEIGAAVQGIQQQMASLTERPGESPEEVKMREEALELEKQAEAMKSQALSARESAASLRSEGEEKEAEEKEKEAEAAALKAQGLRAAAADKRYKAYGIAPVMQAMRDLVTDGFERFSGKLLSDIVKLAGSGKLATDGTGQVGNGGLAAGKEKPTPKPEPQRMSLSASAEHFIGKFAPEGGGPIREAAFNEMIDKAGIKDAQQRLQLKMELQAAGALIG